MSRRSHSDESLHILSQTAGAIAMTIMILPYCAPEIAQMGKKLISSMMPPVAKRLTRIVTREVAWLITAPRR